MNTLIKKYASNIIPALLLEDLISHKTRKRIFRICLFVDLISLVIFLFLENNFSKGVFLFITGIILTHIAIESFYYSNFTGSFESKNNFSFPLA